MRSKQLTEGDQLTLPAPVPGRFAAWGKLPAADRTRIGWLAAAIGVITLLFIQPLTGLALHAGQHELHSHIPLIPVIAGYLLYSTRRSSVPLSTSMGPAVVLVCVTILAAYAAISLRPGLSLNDYLALTTFAYLSLLAATGFVFLGLRWMVSAAFPLAFLLFMIPMPDAAASWVERGLVLASADAAAWLFSLTGTPLLREGTVLAIPGITLEVAQECSGIRSTWVLFITSVMASRMFLNSTWRRIVLVAFVIPLGIIRNAFRILVIGLLCVHVGPHMIASPIHSRGGPLFFALSLIPLFLLLWALRRRDHRGATAA